MFHVSRSKGPYSSKIVNASNAKSSISNYIDFSTCGSRTVPVQWFANWFISVKKLQLALCWRITVSQLTFWFPFVAFVGVLEQVVRKNTQSLGVKVKQSLYTPWRRLGGEEV
jgi:hypothetical protein